MGPRLARPLEHGHPESPALVALSPLGVSLRPQQAAGRPPAAAAAVGGRHADEIARMRSLKQTRKEKKEMKGSKKEGRLWL